MLGIVFRNEDVAYGKLTLYRQRPEKMDHCKAFEAKIFVEIPRYKTRTHIFGNNIQYCGSSCLQLINDTVPTCQLC